MIYSIDTNALIEITRSKEVTDKFIAYVASHENDRFFVMSYVVDEFLYHFQSKPNDLSSADLVQLKNYARLDDHIAGIYFDDTEFFTLDQSILDGGDILASGISGFPEIDVSKDAYEKSGSKRDYDLWKRSKRNDRIISEMSEAKRCDAILTRNKKDFNKIPRSFHIVILELNEILK